MGPLKISLCVAVEIAVVGVLPPRSNAPTMSAGKVARVHFPGVAQTRNMEKMPSRNLSGRLWLEEEEADARLTAVAAPSRLFAELNGTAEAAEGDTYISTSHKEGRKQEPPAARLFRFLQNCVSIESECDKKTIVALNEA